MNEKDRPKRWEKVLMFADHYRFNNTQRLPVPGGWLYRNSTGDTGEPENVTMCFVPTIPEVVVLSGGTPPINLCEDTNRIKKCTNCGQFDSGGVYPCKSTGGHSWI